MNSGKNAALGLLKSIAASTKSLHVRTRSIESAYRMSPADSTEWLLGISADTNRRDLCTEVACNLRLPARLWPFGAAAHVLPYTISCLRPEGRSGQSKVGSGGRS